MSTSSSIEAINEDEIDEADDEGWEVLQNPQIGKPSFQFKISPQDGET